jgi:hypothetical protein
MMTRCQETRRNGESGVVLVLFVLSLVATLAAVGLAVDLGTAYITRSRMAKAIDAGALAASRYTHKGESAMEDIALDIARANFTAGGAFDYDVTIDYPSTDAVRVELSSNHELPGMFSRLIGQDSIGLHALGEATRFPLDLVLVLDVSYSLVTSNSWDELIDASQAFVEYFDDDIDQFALVSYSTSATTNMPITKIFKSAAQSAIGSLNPISYTNIDEGLRHAKVQLDNAPVRQDAVKIAVLFTDGRPTAFRDDFSINHYNAPDPYDGVVAAYSNGSWYAGLFDPDDGKKVVGFYGNGSPILVPYWYYYGSPWPFSLPGGLSVNGDNIRALGISQAEEQADSMRAAGYTIYTIGLGNPQSPNEGDQPDLDFLQRLANEDGISNPAQPKGTMVFSPDTTELETMFSLIADRILRRITG